MSKNTETTYDAAIETYLRDFTTHGVWADFDTLPMAVSAARRDLALNAVALGVSA